MTDISASAFGIDNDAPQVGMTVTKRILTGLALGGVLMFLSHDATAAQAPVALGGAASFGVLAGPTVTSTGATTVNGDLGVSPGTTVTGAPTVTGTLHLGDPVAAQAQLDLTTAYNDAAGRTVGAVAVAGNLGGLTLTPGLYKSTSSLEISSGDLTLDAQGDVNAVFIFQMASTLVTTSGRQVILSGGARAANIFWQVGSSATLGTISVFKGNILALASITLTTGARLEGRALARTAAVTLDSNTVGLGTPADTAPPTVSSTDPANAATGVAINKRIAATFSEAMDASTISTTTVTLRQGATPVAGTVTYVGTTATFAPASALAASTTYNAAITTGVKDLAGNAMAAAFGWSFTTGAAPDTTAPTVTITDPANSATAVALNKKVAVTFSEAMDPLTISIATFTLKQGTTPVAGAVTYAAVGATATFTPAIGLAASTTFAATITTGAKDLAGNALLSSVTWSFTTGAAPDTTPPTTIATVPANIATGVGINQTINLTFSEAMDPTTITTANFTVAGPGTTPVTGTVAYDAGSKIATFTPAGNLAANTVYRATMTTGAKDLAGNALASNFSWNFTTAATTAGQTPVALGSATTFVVLAGSTVTSTGATAVDGDLGVSPGTAVTGFPPGSVNGAIHAGDAAAAQAQLDLTTAYNDAAGRTVGAIAVAGNLGGQTLAPGLYKSTSSLEISSGDLTLDAQGDANAVFVFQMASTLTTTSGRQVILSGGAQAANIFWQVGSSATLGTTSAFKGNILALASITLATGATLEGRALARNAAVTLDSNTITSSTTSAGSWTLWWQHASGRVAVWHMNGINLTSAAGVEGANVPHGWRIAATPDFAGNGQRDLLLQSPEGHLSTWFMQDNARQSDMVLGAGPVLPSWKIMAAADLRGSGHKDILWENDNGSLACWFMDSTNFLGASPLTPGRVDPSWQIVGTGDFNSDGQKDILWQNDDGTVAVWFMNGTNAAQTELLNPSRVDPLWRIVATVDLDGDGHTDLIWQSNSGVLAYWRMNGVNLVSSGLLNPSRVVPAWRVVGPR